jgi:hypothetical protein
MSGVSVKTRTEVYLDIMGSLKWLPVERRDELTDFVRSLIEGAVSAAEKRIRDEKDDDRYDEIEAAREDGYECGYRNGQRAAEKDD